MNQVKRVNRVKQGKEGNQKKPGKKTLKLLRGTYFAVQREIGPSQRNI